ncbi:MAG TPA: hypothetical protein VGF91_02730 [Solirubrobacteraceae bacterium]|jgi:hypothetical protein
MYFIRRAILATGAIAAVALLAAGCGGNSPTTTTNGSGSAAGNGPPKDIAASAYKYSACMRNHGVANFPDPRVQTSTSGGSTKVAVMIPAAGLSSSPNFKSAQTACRGILPAPSKSDLAQQAHDQQVHKEDLLAFTRCLRNHGVNGFPDPNSQGQLSLAQVQAAGIDLQAPSVKTAALTCVPSSGGGITRADVEQATSGNPPQGGQSGSESQGSASAP